MNAQRRAAGKYYLKWDDFQERHELISTKFEEGKLILDEYLEYTVVFYERREFSRDTFTELMFSQSPPIVEILAQMKTSPLRAVISWRS